MEESISQQSESVDIESVKLDAIIQLRTWQKKMHTLVDRTYKARLHEIESLANEELKTTIHVHEAIPENFETKIERTIRVSPDELADEEDEEDDDDAPVIVDFDEHEVHGNDRVVYLVASNDDKSKQAQQGTMARVLNSQPIQNVIASTLARTITQIGVITATSTTTAAATTMAKTAIIATACGVGTVAYGVGKVAIGTTSRIWSYMVSPDD